MAKKKQDLSPEERLAAALVPEEEWPYALPDGWKWVRVKGLCKLNNGKAFKPKDWKENGVPIVRIQNLNDSTAPYHYYDGDIEDKFHLYGNELLFAWSGTPGTSFGAHIWCGKEAVLNQHIFRVDFDDHLLDKTFFKHALNQQLTMLINKAHGGAGLQHVTKGAFEATPICVPPLSEQRRLVARIESLFAKLDAAKEKVQSVLDSHENRKAALLHDAFAGKLTAKWRREQGLSLNVWRIEKLENLCEKITCGKTPKNDIAPQGEIPYLKVYNIVNDEIDFQSKPQYIPRDVHETKLQSSKLKPNDVVMNIVGPPLRKIAVIPDTYPEWNMNQAIVRFRPKADLNYRFLYYALLNPETLDDVIQKTKGVVGQANISITQSRNLKIKLPSLPEQQQIVRILDRLLAHEQRARQAAEETLAAIDRMKQAILARAFRGEL